MADLMTGTVVGMKEINKSVMTQDSEEKGLVIKVIGWITHN